MVFCLWWWSRSVVSLLLWLKMRRGALAAQIVLRIGIAGF